jgi:hypothetical protein
MVQWLKYMYYYLIWIESCLKQGIHSDVFLDMQDEERTSHFLEDVGATLKQINLKNGSYLFYKNLLQN